MRADLSDTKPAEEWNQVRSEKIFLCALLRVLIVRNDVVIEPISGESLKSDLPMRRLFVVRTPIPGVAPLHTLARLP